LRLLAHHFFNKRVGRFMAPEEIIISVNETDSVSGLVYHAPDDVRQGATLVLGHGAGGNQSAGFMVLFASRLAVRGIDAATFNFVYTEKKRKIPDRTDKLESCYRAVIAALQSRAELAKNSLFIGGKSMGGRIASHLASQGVDGLSGCVFLGYPLHPPGNPDRLRAAHLSTITVPLLFVQGSKDTFGTPEELRPILAGLTAPSTLEVIEGGDHSFKVPKKGGPTQDEIYNRVIDRIVDWMTSIGLTGIR
jgi:predicted alpha/beta-hydrolase family hydrolase